MNLPLILQFTRQDLVDRYAGSLLGGLWTFIQPLVNMLVFILVFSQLMGARLPELSGSGRFSYSIYLVAGLLGWIAFASTLTRTTTAFIDKAHLITKVHLALWGLPLSIVLSDSIVFLISWGFFVAFLILIDHPLSVQFLWIPLIFALQQTFAYSLGMVLAILGVFLRDIRELVTVVLQLWFWLTPIVYVFSIIPESLRPWLQLNPMFPVIDAYHRVVLLGAHPQPLGLLLLAAITCLLFLLGRWLFVRLERDIRDLI
ncbi:MAG: ABC transporter permease [Chromatiaceae bacterium]|nr:ABC transporter permease [Chromatiaceae bacterium]MCF8002730.1 ABC transporter permease [Chromatiaceae bacterium]